MISFLKLLLLNALSIHLAYCIGEAVGKEFNLGSSVFVLFLFSQPPSSSLYGGRRCHQVV